MFREKQKYKNKYYEFDIDSSPEVYELYKKIYQEDLGYSIDNPKFFNYMDNGCYTDAPLSNQSTRLYALPKSIKAVGHITIKNIEYNVYRATERLSGDCFFNFNFKKTPILNDISGIDKEKLKTCASMHYSIYNMVLLQTMGNMQKRKQEGLKNEQLDRGDTFLYLLNKFYCESSDEILSASSGGNKSSLRDYLDNFKNVYEYSRVMLQIEDKAFIDKMIENGSKKLDSSNVNEYLDIAIEFWERRKNKIDPLIENL